MTATFTNKPDKTNPHPDRQWLAEIKDGTVVVDAAYFLTKAAAQEWARNSYRV